jgi:hypothetical protein
MGKAKGFIGLLLVVTGFYVAWNMIPPYFHNYQLQDDLDDVARRHSYTAATEDDIRTVVITQAAADDVVLKEDEITVVRNPMGVGITVKYRVHIDMVLHPVDVDFVANSMNKRI